MIEIGYILFTIALTGSLWASYHDLRTTEIPDYVPLSMFILGLITYLFYLFTTKSYDLILKAFIVGLIFLSIGYIQYFLGQWGEADTLLFGVIGFLIPEYFSFFKAKLPSLLVDSTNYYLIYTISFLLTLVFVGAFYSIIFSVIYSLRVKNFFKNFFKKLMENSYYYIGTALIINLIAFYLKSEPVSYLNLNLLVLFSYILVIFAYYSDKNAFKKKISVKDLREGDVLAEPVKTKDLNLDGKKFIGLTKEQISKIKKSGKKTILIKEGVRYAPAFFLTLLFLWIYGEILSLFFA